jgi:tetratricopeptide (TPR) repeat protein
VYVALGQIYAGAKKRPSSSPSWPRRARGQPEEPGRSPLTGAIYQQKGDIPKAIQAYEEVMALNPRSAVAANNLRLSYRARRRPGEGAADGPDRQEALPDQPGISDTLGWILSKRGVYQRALALLKESAAKLPDNPEIQYHLGMTHYKLKDNEAAKQSLARALKLRPQFPGADEARRTLAEIEKSAGPAATK